MKTDVDFWTGVVELVAGTESAAAAVGVAENSHIECSSHPADTHTSSDAGEALLNKTQ